jgi:hypothetical protein
VGSVRALQFYRPRLSAFPWISWRVVGATPHHAATLAEPKGRPISFAMRGDTLSLSSSESPQLSAQLARRPNVRRRPNLWIAGMSPPSDADLCTFADSPSLPNLR